MLEFEVIKDTASHLFFTILGIFLIAYASWLSHREWFIARLPKSLWGIASSPVARIATLFPGIYFVVFNIFWLSPSTISSQNRAVIEKRQSAARDDELKRGDAIALELALKSRPVAQVRFEELLKVQAQLRAERMAVSAVDPDLYSKNSQYLKQKEKIEREICNLFASDSYFEVKNWVGFPILSLDSSGSNNPSMTARILSYEIDLPLSRVLSEKLSNGVGIPEVSFKSGSLFSDEYKTLILEEKDPVFFRELLLIDQSNTRGAVIFSGRVFSSKDLGGGFNDSSKHPFECLHRNSMMRFSGSATLSNLEEPGPEFHFKLTAMQVLQ